MLSALVRRYRKVSSHRRTGGFAEARRRLRFCLETLEARLALTGTWTPLAQLLPTALPPRAALLSDGKVLVGLASANGGSILLTPNATGSYVDGAWSAASGFSAPRQQGAQTVLPDGRVLLLGGVQNGISLNAGEIYNPTTNAWTSITPFPESTFGNGPTMLLADGRLLAGSIQGPQTYIYSPNTNSWSAGPTKLDNDSSLHESWTKLADGSILSYNVNSNVGHAQRLDQTTMTWIDSGTVPVALQSGVSAYLNMGPGMLLPDGRLLQLGRSSETAIYTPSSTPGGTGTWAAGPVIPDGLQAGGSDPVAASAAAMLPNGHVLFAADKPDAGGPTRFYEFDPTAPLATSLTDVTPPIAQYQNLSVGYAARLLMLPSGQMLVGNGNTGGQLTGTNQLYVYTPDGLPQTAWKPTITNVATSGSNSFTLTGTQLNGLSAGASNGASTQLATNYPIVQLTAADGKVYYARSFNWSSTGVATGSTPVTTQFSLPSSIPLSNYSLRVVANGIASDPVSFTGGTASANDIYAWDITAENRKRNNKQEARISVVVRRDSNANGASGSNDAVLNNVNVTLQLRTSSGALIGTASGSTNSQGKFTSGWFSNLANGTYVAEVTALARSGYTWNKVLDPTSNDTDLDGDNLPDQAFPVPAGAAMSLFAKAESTANTESAKTASVSITPQLSSSSSVPKLNAVTADEVMSSLSENRTRRLRLGTLNVASSDDYFAVSDLFR